MSRISSAAADVPEENRFYYELTLEPHYQHWLFTLDNSYSDDNRVAALSNGQLASKKRIRQRAGVYALGDRTRNYHQRHMQLIAVIYTSVWSGCISDIMSIAHAANFLSSQLM